MAFCNTFNAAYISKKWTFCLSGLLILLTPNIYANSLPVPVGPPVRISPVPGPANPDPILQNLVSVLDNHYQLPWYPGGAPDYLSQIYFLSDFYIVNHVNFNPCDDSLMHATIGQNVFVDYLGIFINSIGSNTFANSYDRGKTWSYGPPIEQIIPLGGNISHIINASLGPGLYNIYGKNGRLYAGGWGFFDMTNIPPQSIPQGGFLFTSSDDDGKTWKTQHIELASNQDLWWLPSAVGQGPREFYITPDPANPDLIHASSMFVLSPGQFYGNLFYNYSKDAGKTFSPLKQIYSMIDDPTWREKSFDPSNTDPTYYSAGGFCLSSGFPTKVDDNILMLPTLRLLNLDQFGFPLTGDQAAIRSLDNGKTWLREAGATPGDYLVGTFIIDPAFANPFAGQIVNGSLVFPFFFDIGGQWASPIVSAATGRIYFTYCAFNQAISDVSIGYSISHILVNVSDDKGKTFSQAVQINRTPTNISPGAQQAFAQNAVITKDGYYCVAYYDFRNWTGSVGEDVTNTPLQTDVWLDVYRETEDPRGGSTGIGLDFVGEIRLTQESFNARIIPLNTATPYSTPFLTGTPEGIPMTINNNNELFIAYSVQSGVGVSPANISIGYKGITIDRNSYVTDYLQRLKFPNISNQ